MRGIVFEECVKLRLHPLWLCRSPFPPFLSGVPRGCHIRTVPSLLAVASVVVTPRGSECGAHATHRACVSSIPSADDAEIVDQIKDLLETRIRPAVAGDGGDIAYRGYSKGIVHLQLQGACDGCPSATATLKHGIEGLLKHYVPEVVEVRAT